MNSPDYKKIIIRFIHTNDKLRITTVVQYNDQEGNKNLLVDKTKELEWKLRDEHQDAIVGEYRERFKHSAETMQVIEIYQN